jgi:hypothetical protein
MRTISWNTLPSPRPPKPCLFRSPPMTGAANRTRTSPAFCMKTQYQHASLERPRMRISHCLSYVSITRCNWSSGPRHSTSGTKEPFTTFIPPNRKWPCSDPSSGERSLTPGFAKLLHNRFTAGLNRPTWPLRLSRRSASLPGLHSPRGSAAKAGPHRSKSSWPSNASPQSRGSVLVPNIAAVRSGFHELRCPRARSELRHSYS